MRRILIIGASSGIGRQVALDFASGGWRVGIAGRDEERLRGVKSLYPDRIVYSVIDVTADDAPRRFLDLIELTGGMDVLLMSAGVGWMNPSLDGLVDVDTVAVNCSGFVRIIDAAYNYYKSAATTCRGHIAAITSVAGTKGIGVAASYSASKRFQSTYIDALEQLARQEGVAVDFTDLRPGFIDTPLLNGTRDLPMTMPLSYAVPKVVRAILRRRRIAYIDWRWGALTVLLRALPRAVWKRIRLTVSQKQA